MNCFHGVGRIFQEPKEIPYGPEKQKIRLFFKLCCKREYKDDSGRYAYDFIPCTCYIKDKYDYIKKAYAKGITVDLYGELYTQSYEDKNHVWHSYWEVRVSCISFGMIPCSYDQLGMKKEEEVQVDW